MTARDTLVGLLGEAKADEVIEQAARAMSSHWRDMHTNESLGFQRMLALHTLAAVLPDLLAPEVITTREEADALPDGVVVLDSHRAGRNDTRVSLAAPD